MISAMLWSISSTPAPWSSRTERTTAAKSGTSASGRPAAGSSISTKRGSARARGRRRAGARRRAASAAAGIVGVAAEPEQPEQLVGARAARARPGADAERRHLDVLAHRQVAERVAVLERARETVPGPPVRRPARDVAVAERDPALVRPVEPAEHVDERRLAGAVRADQADDLAAAQLERDAAERLDARRTTARQRRPEAFRAPSAIAIGFCFSRQSS